MRLLKATLLFQVLVGLYWMFPVAMGPIRGWGGLYLLFIIFVPLLAVVAIAMWSFCRRPETRRLAVVVFFTPLVIFLAPFLFRGAFGGIIGSPGGGFAEASIATVIVLVAVLVLLPGRVAELIPRTLLRSRDFNVTLVVSLSVMLAVWLVVLTLLKTPFAYEAKNLLFALLYAVVCALTATPILVYSYYAMFQRVEREHHKLRIAQLALSVAVLLPAAFGLYYLVKLAPLLTPPG
jgi:hypothetical protein